MIPKYSRCCDPSQKCPLSITKETFKDNDAFKCPCSHINCSVFREQVSFLSVHRIWFYSAGAIALLILCVFLLSGKDSCQPILDGFQTRLDSLSNEIAAIEKDTKTNKASENKKTSDLVSSDSDIASFVKQTSEALASGNMDLIHSTIKSIDERINLIRASTESINKPESGSGVKAATAKSLLAKLISLKQEVEEQHKIAEASCPHHLEEFENLDASVASAISQARRHASSATGTSQTDVQLIASLQKSITDLTALKRKLESFVPPIPIPIPIQIPEPLSPFQKSEANFLIAAAPGLSDHLVGPLAEAWTNSKLFKDSEGSIYIDGGVGKKIIIEAYDAKNGFRSLASGQIALYFANRAPSKEELLLFGSSFKESRSVAEVIALDAMTLLVHPENTNEIYKVGEPISMKVASGSFGTPMRQKSEQFGLISSTESNVFGERAAMQEKNIIACSLYHLEGQNLRAKRLAVKASKEAPTLKPSPFTIATEEYVYSYRIVAWTPNKASDLALSFVKFITSNDGQTIVEKQGFVDLRLRASSGDVDPMILAALGTAIGVDSVTSAQRLSTNIKFPVGESQLDVKAQADIERITREAAANFPTHKVVIMGFTDSTGPANIHKPLSEKRAEGVVVELRKFKVDAHSCGLGELFPIDANDTEAGRARNRRAEVWVVKP
jgi:outer membrane protein OmpA-like peptidoglycan-associated protein/uncharacterized protein YoxC